LSSIGIFDSGIGGLTVLKALKQALPHESFIYLGDTARLPYGSKSPRTISRYLAQNMAFLASRKVKAAVVACNTASSVLESDHWDDIPIYGVVEPGAQAAVAASKGGRIAVLGTKATVASGAYIDAIEALNADVVAMQQACPLLVPLVEEGWEADDVTRLVLQRYLAAPLAFKADTLILGCTHYPVLKSAIRKLVPDDVQLIDSAVVMAEKISTDLKLGKIKAERVEAPSTQVFTTDTSEGFHDVGERILRPCHVDRWDLADL
jgi:glutamate racemase